MSVRNRKKPITLSGPSSLTLTASLTFITGASSVLSIQSLMVGSNDQSSTWRPTHDDHLAPVNNVSVSHPSIMSMTDPGVLTLDPRAFPPTTPAAMQAGLAPHARPPVRPPAIPPAVERLPDPSS